MSFSARGSESYKDVMLRSGRSSSLVALAVFLVSTMAVCSLIMVSQRQQRCDCNNSSGVRQIFPVLQVLNTANDEMLHFQPFGCGRAAMLHQAAGSDPVHKAEPLLRSALAFAHIAHITDKTYRGGDVTMVATPKLG